MDIKTEADNLRRVPMFSKLDPTKLKLLAFTSESLTFNHHEIVFREGDPADCAYVVMDGEVEIVTETDAGEVVEVTLGKNALVGELGVLTNSPRSSTIRAKERMTALRISDEMFLKLVAENPDVALDVMRQLSDKLIQSHNQFIALQTRVLREESAGTT